MLTEARDLGLYSGMTDNGAGGLSSSIGEMATATGGSGHVAIGTGLVSSRTSTTGSEPSPTATTAGSRGNRAADTERSSFR